MAEAIVILIFVVAFALVWYGILYLIKHPDITIDLEGKVLAHEPNLEEYENLVLTYLHNEEVADVDELVQLVGSKDSTVKLLAHLERRGLVNIIDDDDGEILVTRL